MTTPTPEQQTPTLISSQVTNNKLSGRSRRWWTGLLLVIVLGGVFYYVWHLRGAGKSSTTAAGGHRRFTAEIMPVGIAKAKSEDVKIYLTGLGSVTPTATTIVRNRVDGELRKLHFTEGQLVKQGALRAEIARRTYQVVVTQAEGQLARDAALLNSALWDLKRYRTLLEQDSIARQQVDTQAALVKQYEGTVKSDQGNLDNARLQLSFTRVTAPVSGRLGLRHADIGNLISSSDTTGIVTITQVQPITAIFSIPEDSIPQVVQKLQAATVMPTEAWDRAQKKLLATGTLLSIDNQVDATTGTVKLKAQFPNVDFSLFPNQFVNIRLLVDIQKGATVVPTAAVQRGEKGMFVYLVKADHTVAVQEVTTGAAQDEDTIIEKGITPGDMVVIDGIDRLREGQQVNPVERGANDPAASLTSAPGPGSRSARASKLSPEEQEKRWAQINKRIDAGEFGEELKKLPESERRQRMMEMRRANRSGSSDGHNAASK